MTKRSKPLPKKLGVTEVAVMIAVAKGERVFGGHREIMALHKLAARGWIEVEVKAYVTERRRSYNFGRHTKYDHVPEAGAHVKAPKIEAAIERHGLATMIRAIRGEGAKASPVEGQPKPF